jgi:SHS2 domain-containing protein
VQSPFAEIDHSGDVGIEARGRNVSELLTNATLGLFSLLYRGEVRPVVERVVRVESNSLEDLIVDWLGEVIAIGNAHGEMYQSVIVHDVDQLSAEGVLAGEPVDRDKHDLRFDVKAATYHALSVTKDDQGLRARVILDL